MLLGQPVSIAGRKACHFVRPAGELVAFLLSEVDLPRFGVLDPPIIRSLARVKPPITSIRIENLSQSSSVSATHPAGVLGWKDSAISAIWR
jgi:hypothetical protein